MVASFSFDWVTLRQTEAFSSGSIMSMMKVSRGVFRDADIGLVHAVIAVVHRIAAVAYRGPVRRVVVGFHIGLFHEI